MKIPEKLKRTELWVAVIAALVPVLNEQLGLKLDSDMIISIMGALSSYVISRGLAKYETTNKK